MEAAETNYRRLLMLIDEAEGAANLARRLGHKSSSTISQYKSRLPNSKTGKPKDLGKALARRLESVCGKPRGWMDQPLTDAEMAVYGLDRCQFDRSLRRSATNSFRETEGRLDQGVSSQETIGQRIRKLRTKKQMTMKQLAEKLDVVWQTVQQWEDDKAAPNRKRVKRVADQLGVSVAVLMFGTTQSQTTSVRQSEDNGGELDNADNNSAKIKPERSTIPQRTRSNEDQARLIVVTLGLLLRVANMREDTLGSPSELENILVSGSPRVFDHELVRRAIVECLTDEGINNDDPRLSPELFADRVLDLVLKHQQEQSRLKRSNKTA